ncbi:MAG: hypothetical protein OHK0056_26690 [Bacteriovoracaceae bacterium]
MLTIPTIFKDNGIVKFNIFRQRGFTLVEVMVAVGLSGIIAVAAIQIMGQVGTVINRSKVLADTMNFSNNLSRFLYGPNACDEIRDEVFSTTESDFIFENWNYEGKSTIGVNAEFGTLKITSLKASIDDLAGLPTVSVSGVTLTKTMLHLNVEIMAQSKRNTFSYNIPVLVTSAGQVKYCGEMKDSVEICNSMLGVFDPVTGKCNVQDACKVRGSYKLISCSPMTYGCDSAYGTNTNNPLTGDVTCPSGAVATQTGVQTWNHSVSCGKKCTATIFNTAQWYTCLECPP